MLVDFQICSSGRSSVLKQDYLSFPICRKPRRHDADMRSTAWIIYLCGGAEF